MASTPGSWGKRGLGTRTASYEGGAALLGWREEETGTRSGESEEAGARTLRSLERSPTGPSQSTSNGKWALG